MTADTNRRCERCGRRFSKSAGCPTTCSHRATMIPEIGQMAFGNPWGDHTCPQWVDALVREILREIDRVFWNRNQREWNKCEDPGIPGIEYRPYYWGDDPDEVEKPNLKHGEVEVRWYKHPMRSSSLNIDAAAYMTEVIAWFESAIAAVQAHDGLPGKPATKSPEYDAAHAAFTKETP